MKRLIQYLITDKLFNDFVAYFEDYHGLGSVIEECDESDFIYGHPDKISILVDFKNKSLCCTTLSLKEFDPFVRTKCKYRGYQCVIKADDEHGSASFAHIRIEYSPHQAVKEMNKVLRKHYDESEIDACLRSHQKENFDKQMHDVLFEQYQISEYRNCWYWDISGAHTYILSEIFPEAADDLKYWNDHKHDRNCSHFKKIPNFYVGCLGKKDSPYRKTYHWIVGEVNRIMNEAFEKTHNMLKSKFIYINTDGFIIQHPKELLEASNELGKFKCEYDGTVYTYAGKNYQIIQYGDTIKGNLPTELRRFVDLRIGKVVEYDRVKVGQHYEYKNIREVQLNGKKTFK